MRTLKEMIFDELKDSDGHMRFAPHAPELMVDVIVDVVEKHRKQKGEQLSNPITWYLNHRKTELKLSQKDIAEACEVTPMAVNHWFGGKRNVPLQHWGTLKSIGFTEIERAAAAKRLLTAAEF